MLRSRLIAALTISNNHLVKTVNFKNPKYVGDPFNAVRIFNEKKIDELIIIDQSASINNLEPNYELIERIASVSSMPLCYGGGIKTFDQARNIISLGFEKVSINSHLFVNKNLISEISSSLGSQSVVASIDVLKLDGKYRVTSHSNSKIYNNDIVDLIKFYQSEGAGEILINNIDHDGAMCGYDYELINLIQDNSSIPITYLGGAGSLDDFNKIYESYYPVGLAASSFFIFRGPFKAVLISYPDKSLIKNLYHE